MVAILFIVALDQVVKPELALFRKLVVITRGRPELKRSGRQVGFEWLDTAIVGNHIEIGSVNAVRLDANS